MRIVSLIPSATEIVCALGFQDRLVGRSHECDYPAAIAELPVVTRPRFDPEGTSREIDERVKSLAVRSPAADALGVYEVLTDVLRELRPTHIVTQAQCEVCAVSLRDVERAVAEMTGVEAVIVSLEPNSLEDVWADFRRAASALGDAAAGERLVDNTAGRIESVRRLVAGRPAVSVAGIEWADPLMAFGNWTPTLIEAAGGRNLLGRSGEHSPWISFDDLARADADMIVMAPCGYGLERSRQDLALLQANPAWAQQRAVRQGRVAVADGNQFFNRPGPRLADTVEILAEMLHPKIASFGREGRDWERAA